MTRTCSASLWTSRRSSCWSGEVPLIDFFSGGLEMLFGNESKHTIQVPARDVGNAPINVAYLVRYLCEDVMKDKRKELFVLDGSM